MAIETGLPEPEQLHRDLEELVVDGYARMYIDREPALALIRADRAAVARAAKLELLEEMRVAARLHNWTALRVIHEFRAKYGAAKEPG